jgi:hypothetical protein
MVAHQQQRKKMAAKKKSTKKATTTEPKDEYAAQPETAAPAIDADEPPEIKTGPTLADVAAGYLAAIEKDDAGPGTISSYGMELKTALRELGENTLVADLTPERVQKYFESDAVMRKKNGEVKAQPTWAKTRRVLRLALCWAQDAGIVEVAPIPATPKNVA